MNDKNNRKKKEEPQDILSMIRARQEENNIEAEGIPVGTAQTNKSLKAFLDKLNADDTIDADYSNTPIFKMGHEDGYQEGHDDGYNEAYSELYAVLKAIETVIKPHIKSEC